MKAFYFLIFLLFLYCCKKQDADNQKSNQNYQKATEFRDYQQEDSAFVYYNKSIENFKEKNDTIGIGKALINMSIIQCNKGDYFGTIETAVATNKLLKNRKDATSLNLLASSLNTMAIASLNLNNYQDALKYYFQAKALSNNEDGLLVFDNNIGDVYLELNRVDSALFYFEKAIQTDNVADKARAITNKARAKLLQNPTYNAAPELLTALHMREQENNLWGQNSSHAHLSDYFYGKDNAKSLFHAEKMMNISTQLNSPDDQLLALQKLILLENPESSKRYFHQYQKLNDSLQTARAKAKNQFALIRYETEKEKLENVKKQNHILKQNIAIGVLAISLFGGYFMYRKRRKRLQQEKEIEVKNTQLKYSKKVHDVVANGLYHTMVNIQNTETLDKEKLLNQLEKMYEESRDIARDDVNDITEKEFFVRLAEMTSSYSAENQRVLLMGNTQENWAEISASVQSEVYYVLREALINMKKHSKATLSLVKIEKSGKRLQIKYTDNGIGIQNHTEKASSGIQNMENRIAGIGGEIIFEKNPKDGVVFTVSIPI